MPHGDMASLVNEIGAASERIGDSDTKLHSRLVERELNALMLKSGRPGADWNMTDDEVAGRDDAVGLCRTRRALNTPRTDAGITDDYTPSASEIDEA